MTIEYLLCVLIGYLAASTVANVLRGYEIRKDIAQLKIDAIKLERETALLKNALNNR